MTRTTSKKRSSRKRTTSSASTARHASSTRSKKGASAKRTFSKAGGKKSSGKKASGKKGASKKAHVETRNKPLSALTDEALRNYFANLNGHRPADLYQLVIGEVERPLLNAVLIYANGNQSVAATILGINRGTLRKKLRAHNLLDG